MPWGTGDTPIREVLQLLKREKWPIRAYVEYEHRGTAGPVEEVKTCFAYAKQVLGMTSPTGRIGMGLVGPGFVGAHHIDAVRRLGFVDVVAVAGSTEESARAQGRRARRAEAVRQLRSARRRSRRPRRPQHDAELPARAGHHGGARPSQARRLGQAAGDDGRRSARAARCGRRGPASCTPSRSTIAATRSCSRRAR